MTSSSPSRQERESRAVDTFSRIWAKAVACFSRLDQPQWKRTREAMLAFKGLPLDHLPPKLDRRIDAYFVNVNKILARYPGLRTWDDYAMISPVDLTKIQSLIERLADKH